MRVKNYKILKTAPISILTGNIDTNAFPKSF